VATWLSGLVVSLLVTLIPSLLVIVVLWWLDRYEKEPLWLLGIVFFGGAIPTIILSILAQVLLDPPLSARLGHSILYPLANTSIIVPLIEETFKALILLVLFVFYRYEFDGVMDGILYGALIGFGFSVVEDTLYLMRGLLDGGGWAEWGTMVALRVGLYNLNHSVFTACVGVGFGLARNTRKTFKWVLYPVLGWVVAVSLHGIHNAGTVLAESTSGLWFLGTTAIDWMGALGLLALIVLATQQEKSWFEELLPEIAGGVITPDEYQVTAVYRVRFVRGWHVLTNCGWQPYIRWNRFVQLIVDLAYKKHQKKAAGEGTETEELIVGLRQQIAHDRPGLPVLGG
jgi:RsiW-degrading membrane proteinase PrsW (M82 family)